MKPAARKLLEDGLERQDLEAIRQIPKTDLHCHGLLSAPLRVYEEILGRQLPPPPRLFADFQEFIGYIVTHLLPALTGADAIRSIVRATFERFAADGVVYAEISFDLLLPEFVGIS